ncbi:hypothetical protein A2875_00970 [Candidatus Gottesmanbacteria bacterium RIFCSPHIGHO2_01_FULL_46_14]|uniref:LytR/CpsA/Psr regulator C-terminal domain-containing protein n=2 Tax=Candidatus Gottesmaniibacteriota TaxID=1752720 RepID=A0A1F5ZN44_9BACT|nr:MAG: hypothetical protein UX71_C0014G0003 [Parcubacteria group bacterium GW2011_GWA1_47_10]OGG13920.1 MAG: hypothetical protein A2875_00970 [Candidatus Gottesmanbacteria bacterium RIFCSPHIGHO2_01_FULL_46_14]OGG29585.1 MAG: hypothetical protein A2971_00910 [Candidatus Gottesmanbacteria bacterium RIFCSPLOWO2_01_FULL_46_21]
MRRGRRYIGLCILLFFIVGGFVLWTLYKRDSAGLGQINVAIDGDPIIIASWQPDGERLVIVTIPASFTAQAVRGLGRYPVGSLWQLGSMEGLSGDVFRQSLEELIALPIQWSMSGISQSELFSLRSLPRVLFGEIKTNMSFASYLAVWWKVLTISRDHIVEIPLGASVVTDESQADGTNTAVISLEAVDRALTDEFELPSIRDEKLTVAVSNTTATAGLAEHVARMINRIGGNVTALGNEDVKLGGCQIRGTQKHLDSVTSRVLTRIFDCEPVVSEGEAYADIVVAVGTRYESRFVP